MRGRGGPVACILLAACSTVKPVGPPAYRVSFSEQSWEIRPRTAMVLNSVAVDANRHHGKVVEVIGPAPHGKGGPAARLVHQRIVAIEQALAAAGVDERRIVTAPLERADAADPMDAEQVEIQVTEGPPSAPPKPNRKPQKSKN